MLAAEWVGRADAGVAEGVLEQRAEELLVRECDESAECAFAIVAAVERRMPAAGVPAVPM